MSSYFITVCVPARLSAFLVTILNYTVCASKAVCSSCQHTALQCMCQQGCLQFMSPYCITVFVPARLSAVHVTILHYNVCASKSVCSSCHHTSLQIVCQQGSLWFMSPYCIIVCMPSRLSAVHVTILHYRLCAIKPVCSSCHHTALLCVCQQGCLLFMSPYFITVCVPSRLSALHVTIPHYSVCAWKAVCSSCHHTALEIVCQQGFLQLMSPYCFAVCVPTILSAVHVTILNYIVCASNAFCISYHHTSLQCVCQQGFLQFMSPYCFAVCVPTILSAVHITILH